MKSSFLGGCDQRNASFSLRDARPRDGSPSLERLRGSFIASLCLSKYWNWFFLSFRTSRPEKFSWRSIAGPPCIVCSIRRRARELIRFLLERWVAARRGTFLPCGGRRGAEAKSILCSKVLILRSRFSSLCFLQLSTAIKSSFKGSYLGCR